MKYFLVLLSLLSISSCCKTNLLNVDCGKLNPNDFEIDLSIFPEFRNKTIYKAGVYHDIPNEYGEMIGLLHIRGNKNVNFAISRQIGDIHIVTGSFFMRNKTHFTVI